MTGAWTVLTECVNLLGHRRTTAARALCLAALADPALDDESQVKILSMLALTDYFAGDYREAMIAAERAGALAREVNTDAALLFALPIRAFVTTGLPPLPSDTVSPSVEALEAAWQLRERLPLLSRGEQSIAGHFFKEAFFLNGDFARAAVIFEMLEDIWESPLATSGGVNAIVYLLQLYPVRYAAFTGDIQRASDASKSLRGASTAVGAYFIHPTMCLVAGFRGERGLVRELTASVEARTPRPNGYLDATCYALLAYAHAAIGDTAKAAELLRFGCGEALGRLGTADRALGGEILITDALATGDLDEAKRWGATLVTISTHPIAEPTVGRALAALDLALGDARTAADRSEIAAARARVGGSHLMADMADLVHARALAESGLRDRAISRLSDVAARSDQLGSIALRRRAARALRQLGRRVPPAPEAGWAGLSERERQIALLAADGHTNRIIGASLFLSERTVQSHLSRVLLALGLSSRVGLPAAVRPHSPAEASTQPAGLTPRQEEIVDLVALGVPNAEIGRELGISSKTVEKHIGAIFLRWGVSSRTGIARIAIGGLPGAAVAGRDSGYAAETNETEAS